MLFHPYLQEIFIHVHTGMAVRPCEFAGGWRGISCWCTSCDTGYTGTASGLCACTCALKHIHRVWCKTMVTTLFYITSYNSFAPRPWYTVWADNLARYIHWHKYLHEILSINLWNYLFYFLHLVTKLRYFVKNNLNLTLYMYMLTLKPIL